VGRRHPLTRIEKKNRNAVGSEHDERHIGIGGHERIDLGYRTSLVGRPAAPVVMTHTSDSRAVHLLHEDRIRGRQRQLTKHPPPAIRTTIPDYQRRVTHPQTSEQRPCLRILGKDSDAVRDQHFL
jgi:hypothetical protein